MMQRNPPMVWIGLAVWLVGTLFVRLAGQFLFNPGEPALLGLFILSIPLIWALTYPFYQRYRLANSAQRSQAALRLVTLPVLLEVPSFLFHELVYPNMGLERMAIYAAYIFYFYGLVLLTAFIGRQSEDDSA